MDKQQLKHKLRDELIEIGIAAIEHAKKLIAADLFTIERIDRLIALIREKDVVKITAETRKNKPIRPYNIQTCLLEGTEHLLHLALSEKWLSGSSISPAFVGAWNGASCIDDQDGDIKNPLMHAEMDYQNSLLHPRIEELFERVREEEARLKSAAKSAA